MAEKAMLEIPEKFRGFYKTEFQFTDRGTKVFSSIVCRVCGRGLIVPIYHNDIFARFHRYWHYDDCSVDLLENGKL